MRTKLQKRDEKKHASLYSKEQILSNLFSFVFFIHPQFLLYKRRQLFHPNDLVLMIHNMCMKDIIIFIMSSNGGLKARLVSCR